MAELPVDVRVNSFCFRASELGAERHLFAFLVNDLLDGELWVASDMLSNRSTKSDNDLTSPESTIFTGSTGRSLRPVGEFSVEPHQLKYGIGRDKYEPMAVMNSKPSTTLPKTT